MNADEALQAAEAKVRDAENNLAGCVRSLKDHKDRSGSVPNVEVLALVQAQAAVAQAYASVAMAKVGIAMLAAAESGVERADQPPLIDEGEGLLT